MMSTDPQMKLAKKFERAKTRRAERVRYEQRQLVAENRRLRASATSSEQAFERGLRKGLSVDRDMLMEHWKHLLKLHSRGWLDEHKEALDRVFDALERQATLEQSPFAISDVRLSHIDSYEVCRLRFQTRDLRAEIHLDLGLLQPRVPRRGG